MTEVKGIAAASGHAAGRAWVLKDDDTEVARYTVSSHDTENEVTRFQEKASLAIQDIEAIRTRMLETYGEKQAEIFAAHISILQDDEFAGEIIERIRREGINAEAALAEAADELISVFENMDNEYMKARAADFRDVKMRVMKRLAGSENSLPIRFKDPVILFADDLSPSETAQLDRSHTIGFATRYGGKTAHSAIMARSMGIPAVVGLKDGIDQIKSGDLVILDGDQGMIYVNPIPEKLVEYEEKQKILDLKKSDFRKYADKPSITADGIQVELAANIGSIQDAREAKSLGAEGIGLYRTEFLYMGRDSLPTEEEQFQSYKAAAELFGRDRPIVIRTLDIGGDKDLPYLNLPKEMNPFLGHRAIRFCLDRVDIFSTQLRAILRASHYGNIKIMYPMISTLHEVHKANELLSQVRAELDREGIPYRPRIEVGIMIEVPAAALVADQLAKQVDFFSIGTNDLVQYTLAADRMNEKVSYLSQPLHPAVLRLIDKVIQEAHFQGKWVGMCGEMAGNETAVPILLGMGLDEFSMNAQSILPTRALLSRLKQSEMKRLAEEVLSMESADEIEIYVRRNVFEGTGKQRGSETISGR